MILRMFRFRVRRKRDRRLVGFMRRRGLRLLKRSPACRAAYFVRRPDRKREYVWVTLWTNQAAIRAAQRRTDWQQTVREEEAEFFAGKPQVQHYKVLFRK